MCPLPQHSYYYEAHKVAASVWRMLRLVRGRQWGDQRPGGNCWPAVKSEATARPTASSASTPPTPSTSTPATGAAGAAASAGRVSWQPGYGGTWWYMVHGTWADLLPHSSQWGEWEERGGPDLCAGEHQRGTRVRSTLCKPSGAGPPWWWWWQVDIRTDQIPAGQLTGATTYASPVRFSSLELIPSKGFTLLNSIFRNILLGRHHF